MLKSLNNLFYKYFHQRAIEHRIRLRSLMVSIKDLISVSIQDKGF